MKNSNLFLMMAALFALISCGTANRSAYSSGSQFRNSVYYTPSGRSSQEFVQQQQQLAQLQENTAESLSSAASGYEYDTAPQTKGEVSYSFIDNGESYEARLRKFDSPTYTINIDIVDPYPWWNIHYGWYPNRYWRHHYAWYSPSWYWNSPTWYWHSPSWYWGWYDPWYVGPYWGWYDPFYDPWWGPGHRPGFHPGHHPGYHPGHGPGAAPGHRPGRDVYYGKRNSSPTYNNMDRGTVSNGSRNPVARPSTGSATRRQPAAVQINGGTRNPAAPANGTVAGSGNSRPQSTGVQQQKPQQQSGNGQYRRVAPTQQSKSQSNVSTGTQTERKGNSSSYSRSSSQNRNSSTYTRSSSQTRSSSYSSGSSYSGGSRNTGATRSSGSSGGSSYRRR